MGPGHNDEGNSRVWIMREVENSLRRLGTDHIDLYQIHRPDGETEVEETLGALTDLQRQGKIRYFGSSTYPGWQMVEAQWTAERRGLSRFRTEQPPYSIFVRQIEHDVLPVAERYGMGVLGLEPAVSRLADRAVSPRRASIDRRSHEPFVGRSAPTGSRRSTTSRVARFSGSSTWSRS